jgi:probable selenium-dependent hydroxylase accessory protein YqeC
VFLDQFQFELPARVNFVGGGGKTALILSLLREYSGAGAVVYTTTVRIHPPAPPGDLALVRCDDDRTLAHLVNSMSRDWSPRTCRIVATHCDVGPGLLGGVPPAFGERLLPERCPLVLNEADGARGVSLKLPREGEPVLLEGARYLVPVIGLDALGAQVGRESVFRWRAEDPRCPAAAGAMITPVLAAAILMHADGVCRGVAAGTRIVPFINKADAEAADTTARELATAILESGNFPVDRVLWGSVGQGRIGGMSRDEL